MRFIALQRAQTKRQVKAACVPAARTELKNYRPPKAAQELPCCRAPVQGLKAKEAAPLKLAVLGTLRVLAENSQAVSVAHHSYALLPCLKDEDILVQRKVSSLYRVLAEEGQAAMIARDVASIMHCFEATQSLGASLMAPLDALTAIALAGEGRAVARVVERLLAALRDSRAKIRTSTCKTLAAIARGGAKELLGHLGLIDAEIAESCISGAAWLLKG